MQIRQNTLVLNHLSSGSEFLRRDPASSPRTPPLDPSLPLDSTNAPSYPSATAAAHDVDEVATDPSSVYGSRRKRTVMRDRELQAQGIVETAKEMWNTGLERWVRKVQNTDWGVVRETIEERAGYAYGLARREARELERKAEEKSA